MMKKTLILLLLLLVAGCRRPSEIRQTRILILSFKDLDIPAEAPREIIHAKVVYGDLIYSFIKHRKRFFREMKKLNKLKMDAFIPTSDLYYYKLKMIRKALTVPNFPLVLSDENTLEYKKYLKSFIVKNQVQYNILVFCVMREDQDLSDLLRIKVRKNDIRMIFVNQESYDLDRLKETFNVVVTREEGESGASVSFNTNLVHLRFSRSRNVYGTLILDWDLKKARFDDADFEEL